MWRYPTFFRHFSSNKQTKTDLPVIPWARNRRPLGDDRMSLKRCHKDVPMAVTSRTKITCWLKRPQNRLVKMWMMTRMTMKMKMNMKIKMMVMMMMMMRRRMIINIPARPGPFIFLRIMFFYQPTTSDRVWGWFVQSYLATADQQSFFYPAENPEFKPSLTRLAVKHNDSRGCQFISAIDYKWNPRFNMT